ncbi:trypsin-like peptidase domain-containing protein [Methylobacterium sp. WL64]|uniref:S1 family peptidase n=1 Tax=Methylobacterium sp. WL64 TaxID=2603894 RepID=UPI0011CC54AA|nr:serine protease [Methylobacterium sp. WL64]TXM96827.1 trypsin-like peptidase domain-containing protein [Methylobacterium sp. WL64]
MEFALYVLAAGVALGGLPIQANAQPMEALAYIRVGVTDPITQAEKELTQGSGFLIDREGHIVTAKHVVLFKEKEIPGPRWIRVALRDRGSFPVNAQVVRCETDSVDICLIRIQRASVDAANVKTVFQPVCRPLGDTERVVALGFPFGQQNPAIRVPGDITGPLATDNKYPSNVQIVPGMSGGPVVDGYGDVVAVNAGAATGFPTFTFLQPLFYGESLVRSSGQQCPSGAKPPQIGPASLPTNEIVRVPPVANSPACGTKEQIVSRTQPSQNEAAPTAKDYYELIEADKGCRIVSVNPETRSANNSSGPNITIAPDGTKAQVSYSLRSGPFFDRYRGWIDLKLIVNQQPNT